MSIRGVVLRQPTNGTAEQTWDGFSWPALFFGAIWLLLKGLYGYFLISLFALILFVSCNVIRQGYIGNSR